MKLLGKVLLRQEILKGSNSLLFEIIINDLDWDILSYEMDLSD